MIPNTSLKKLIYDEAKNNKNLELYIQMRKMKSKKSKKIITGNGNLSLEIAMTKIIGKAMTKQLPKGLKSGFKIKIQKGWLS